MDIQKRRIEADIVVVEIAGRITLGRECQQVEWLIGDLLCANQKKVIFDISGVDYIDSTGVGIIVTCSGKLTEAGGELRLAGAKGIVDEVLRMTKVNRIVALYPTTTAALEGLIGNPLHPG